MTYTVNSTTGRTTINGATGIVFYLYDTNSGVLLEADTGSGGNAKNRLGWIEPQTAPGSGTWAVGDLATSYFMRDIPNGDYSNNLDSGMETGNSSGAITAFAQDSGGQNWADWDKQPMCPSSCPYTGKLVPDTTLDPTGAFGIFDLNATQNSTTQIVSYCIAISVDKATNANAKGRLVCLNPAKDSPQISVTQE